ncbi:MAG: DUF6057 family protein [Bacteroidaceae bacterium]|nr:DUF6057 family protein [Bacteroidaceae bacterium]
MTKKYGFLNALIVGLLLMVIWSIFMGQAIYRLDFKEQISIFLLSADRIGWYLSNPGVIASITGDWLTQFYINGKAGALLSVLLLAVISAGLIRFYKLADTGRNLFWVLLMAPVFLEGYFIPFPNYPVSATVGLAVTVWAACALAHLKDSRFAPWIYGISVPVMFVLVGGHAFTLALLLGYLRRRDLLSTAFCLLAGLIAMILCGRLYNLTLLQTFVWPVYPQYIIPGKGLLLFEPILTVAVMAGIPLFLKISKEYVREIVLIAILIVGIAVYGNIGDRELERVVKIGTLAYRNDWKGVREMASSDKPNIYRNYYWHLCNAREGRLADDLLKGRWGMTSNGLFLSTSKGDPYFSMMYFTDALLEIGDVSQATDCALLAQTVMPGHYSTRMLRRLAEIAVVTGDYDVAAKYLNILSRTRNHRTWATELMDCIKADSIPDRYLIWRSRTAPVDHFFAQGDIRSSLAIIASESPYNRVAVDYLLCAYLIDKNVNTFVSLYNKYYLNALDRVVDVPDLYQEALLVNVNSDESLRETVGKYRISQRVVEKFLNQMEARSKSDDPNVITQEAVGTYWNYIMAVRLINSNQR